VSRQDDQGKLPYFVTPSGWKDADEASQDHIPELGISDISPAATPAVITPAASAVSSVSSSVEQTHSSPEDEKVAEGRKFRVEQDFSQIPVVAEFSDGTNPAVATPESDQDHVESDRGDDSALNIDNCVSEHTADDVEEAPTLVRQESHPSGTPNAPFTVFTPAPSDTTAGLPSAGTKRNGKKRGGGAAVPSTSGTFQVSSSDSTASSGKTKSAGAAVNAPGRGKGKKRQRDVDEQASETTALPPTGKQKRRMYNEQKVGKIGTHFFEKANVKNRRNR